MTTYDLSVCAPAQVLNINIAVKDFSTIEVFTSNNVKLCNEHLEYSYSLDGITWSCWLSYTNAANILFELDTDYFIRVKIKDSISEVRINGDKTDDYSTSLLKCFDFSGVISNPNIYNPYANLENAMGLYQHITDMTFSITGIPIYYIKLKPNAGSKDITFKEYALMDVDSIKQIKLIVQDGQMPSSKPEFSEWGFDFSTDWETEISKSQFATAFGNTAKPMEGDLVYIPMMKRMWMVNGAYEEKKDGFMWQSTTFKLALVKYEDRGSVDLGDAQTFVDSLVQTKYEDLFGDNENNLSGQDFVTAPYSAADPLYNVFESDAIRKYVKMSNGNESINAKLVSSNKYNHGTLIVENMYDWTSTTEESFIVYQKQYCGADATLSFIITLGNRHCKGTLFKIGNIIVDIDITPKTTKFTVLNSISIEVESNKTYFAYFRWSKQMNIIELCLAEYVHPDMPAYMLKPFNFYFDIDNAKSVAAKYNSELENTERRDIITYSFDGKISNIKIFDKYIDNTSMLLQMLPTHNNLIINDVARKFVEMPGIQNR